MKEVKKVSGEEYTKKTVINTDQKRTIARKAALIEPGCCMFLDGGTTAMYLAKEMDDVPCSVFTNGIAVAMELAQKKNVRIIMLGGHSLPESSREWLSFCNRFYGAELEISESYYGSENFTKLFYRLSDQRPFVDNGIPAIMFTSGITLNNNKTYDSPRTLNYPVLRRRIILIYHWLDKML